MAKKISSLYHLAQNHLSKQNHYDWGLRSVLATLKIAGKIHQINVDMSETVIILHALRDVNLSKLVGEDEFLFYGLLKVCCWTVYTYTDALSKYDVTRVGWLEILCVVLLVRSRISDEEILKILPNVLYFNLGFISWDWLSWN